MCTVTRLRFLRIKYGISLAELAQKAGISPQQLSRIDLGKSCDFPYQEKRITQALDDWLADQKSTMMALERDFSLYKGKLLELVEVKQDEL